MKKKILAEIDKRITRSQAERRRLQQDRTISFELTQSLVQFENLRMSELLSLRKFITKLK